MTKENELLQGLEHPVFVGDILNEIRINDRYESLAQLFDLIPFSNFVSAINFINGTHTDGIISPKIPLFDKEAELLRMPSLAPGWHNVSLFGEDGVETGIGWNFRQAANGSCEYLGVRVISLPGHLVIAGRVPKPFNVRGFSAQRTKSSQAVVEAFNHAVYTSPGLHQLRREKISPRVRF